MRGHRYAGAVFTRDATRHFGAPKPPTLPPPTPAAPPVKSDADVQAAGAAERERLRLRRGRASTLLTSGPGGALDSTAGSVAKATLLGGGG